MMPLFYQLTQALSPKILDGQGFNEKLHSIFVIKMIDCAFMWISLCQIGLDEMSLPCIFKLWKNKKELFFWEKKTEEKKLFWLK